MTLNDLTSALGLMLAIGAVYGGLWALIKTAIRPLTERLEHIDNKMVSRKSTQTVLAMQTREIVGLKRKVMPTINVLKSFLASKGVAIKQKTGEYIGDLTKLYDLPEEDFINEIRILLDGDEDDE